MSDYMRKDLEAIFKYDMPAQARIGVKTFTVLLSDRSNQETDEAGGPFMVGAQTATFLASDLPSVEDETPVYLGEEKFIVMMSTLSADGNALIVTLRPA